MKRLIIFGSALALLAGAYARAEDAPPAQPAPPAAPKKERAHPMMGEMLLRPKVLQDLALTPDQKTKYDELQAAFAKEADAWRLAHKGEMESLHKQMKEAQDAKDTAKVEALQKQQRELFQPQIQVRKQSMDKVRAILTPDQIKTLDADQAAARERMKEHGKPAPAPVPAPAPPKE